ncbi:hypothetical protein CR513_11882, partial [Mucuna pruriens]
MRKEKFTHEKNLQLFSQYVAITLTSNNTLDKYKSQSRGIGRRRKDVFDSRGSSEVVKRVLQRFLLPRQSGRSVLQLKQRLLLPRRALEGASDEERKRRREQVSPQIPNLLLRFPSQAIEVGGGRRPVLEPRDLRDQVGLRPDHVRHAEPLLALAD